MEILLIGNGFDLSCGLPTTYRDFLYFCDAITILCYDDPSWLKLNMFHINTSDAFEKLLKKHWLPPHQIKKKLFEVYDALDPKTAPRRKTPYTAVVRKAYHYLNDNHWYRYFKNRLAYIGNNWIDFEKEISHVIQMLDEAYHAFHKYPGYNDFPEEFRNKLRRISGDFSSGHTIFSSVDIFETREKILDFSHTLSQHLDALIHVLEIYLSAFIGDIDVQPADISPDIAPIHPDWVLSFNYTDTFYRVCGKNRNIDYCYIHGKAESANNIESCNMVLGIDEYLENDRKNVDLEFLPFKKYYQRIYKSTDNTYLDWVKHIRNHNEFSHTLYIFGHSLDVTDKDVLHQLICNDNVQTKIFYYRKHEHDKSVLGQLIHNLVRIIGQDELIRRTGGSHRTIEFIPQTLHK